MAAVSPPASTNSSPPDTSIQRRRGGGIAGTYHPWYRRVRVPATVPHAKPPRPSVSSHSRPAVRPPSSAADHSSGLRTLVGGGEGVRWAKGRETSRRDSLSNGVPGGAVGGL